MRSKVEYLEGGSLVVRLESYRALLVIRGKYGDKFWIMMILEMLKIVRVMFCYIGRFTFYFNNLIIGVMGTGCGFLG